MVNIGQLTRDRDPGQSITSALAPLKEVLSPPPLNGASCPKECSCQAPAGSFDNAFQGLDSDRFLLPLKAVRDQNAAGRLNDWWGQPLEEIYPTGYQGAQVDSSPSHALDVLVR